MVFWKKKDKNHSSSPQEIQLAPGTPARPDHVLVWIDAAYADLPARFVRGMALAEAFRQAAVPNVTLACLPTRNLPGAAEERNIHWLNIRPNGAPVLFSEILETTQADLVLADCLTPPRFQPTPWLALFALISDSYSDSLIASSAVDSLLLPGLVSPPVFAALSLPPSRMADCFHGTRYLPLPALYFADKAKADDASAGPPEEKRFLIAVSVHVNPDSIAMLVECLRESGTGRIQILADVSQTAADRLRDNLAGDIEWLHDPPLGGRWQIIREASWILSYPGLPVYECLLAGQSVILLPRSDPEERICRLVESRGAARVIPAQITSDKEKLKTCLNGWLHDETLYQNLRQNAREVVEGNGARNTVDILLNRFRHRKGK
ncbi:MAG TPA: hypothetical protein PKV38_08890 [bacterium]|nr:hypothetical protein [bacterium]